jgi:hypothetical protein
MSNSTRYEDLLGRVFDEMRGSLRKVLSPADYAVLRDTFVFQMSDWIDGLDGLAGLRHSPDAADLDKATTFIVGFLYDVIPHLNAAGRLLLGEVGDPFLDDEAHEILARADKETVAGGQTRTS